MSDVMPLATVRQCAILVGGLGTRLGALTADLPKPLLPCGDRPFLAWLMRELQRFGVEDFLLLAGHRSERMEAAMADLHRFLPKPARIELSVEPERAGTGGAIYHGRARLQGRFLLCNGDSIFDCNLAALLGRAAAAPQVSAWMMLRPSHDTGRYGVVELGSDDERIIRFEPGEPLSAQSGRPGLINAGIYLFDRALLEELAPACSLEAEILPRLAAAGRLRGVVRDGYFRDIGVPDDLERARTELPSQLDRPALFLDRDGVINHDHGWVGTRERFDWTPDGRTAIRTATDAGMHVFVVTNQSGVARGLYDEEQLEDLHRWMTDEIRLAGGTVDDLRFCPDHEEATVARYRRRSPWRKPGPGMILDVIRAWSLDPKRCMLIGDKATDLAAAHAAGIDGHLTRGSDLLALLRNAGVTA